MAGTLPALLNRGASGGATPTLPPRLQALGSRCQVELKRQLASQEEASHNPEHADMPPSNSSSLSNSSSGLVSEAAEPMQSESLGHCTTHAALAS